jgi:hypothetical protein
MALISIIGFFYLKYVTCAVYVKQKRKGFLMSCQHLSAM